MLEVKDNNVQIPIELWNELKQDLYFNELIEALEDKKDLLEARIDTGEFFDFREYDNQRMKRNSDV